MSPRRRRYPRALSYAFRCVYAMRSRGHRDLAGRPARDQIEETWIARPVRRTLCRETARPSSAKQSAVSMPRGCALGRTGPFGAGALGGRDRAAFVEHAEQEILAAGGAKNVATEGAHQAGEDAGEARNTHCSHMSWRHARGRRAHLPFAKASPIAAHAQVRQRVVTLAKPSDCIG